MTSTKRQGYTLADDLLASILSDRGDEIQPIARGKAGV